MSGVPEATYRRALQALIDFDRRDVLAALRVPVLCLAGSDDRTAPPGMMQKMAAEVQSRERQLRQEVERLKVEIDEVRKQEQVSEITESAYFQELQQKAKALRQGRRRQDPPKLE